MLVLTLYGNDDKEETESVVKLNDAVLSALETPLHEQISVTLNVDVVFTLNPVAVHPVLPRIANGAETHVAGGPVLPFE